MAILQGSLPVRAIKWDTPLSLAKVWPIITHNLETVQDIKLVLITNRSRIWAFDWYQNRWPWMTLNGVMAITLRYFTEFGKPVLQKTICGGIYPRVYCIFYCMYNVDVKKVHVRYLISWWVSCVLNWRQQKIIACKTLLQQYSQEFVTFFETFDWYSLISSNGCVWVIVSAQNCFVMLMFLSVCLFHILFWTVYWLWVLINSTTVPIF